MITYRSPIALDIPVLASLDKIYYPYSPWNAAQFKEELAGVPATRFFEVAEFENQIVGYAGVFVPGPGVEADILTVTVVDEFRRQGIAKRFMVEIEKYAISKAASAMMLEVATDNDGAIALYKSLGYLKISVRMDYYGVGRDADVMRKEFTSATKDMRKEFTSATKVMRKEFR